MTPPKTIFFQRVLTSAVLIGLTAATLFWMNPFYFSAEVIVFIALGLFEFFALMRAAKVPVSPFSGWAMGVAIPIVVCMESGLTESGEVLFLVLGCLFLFVLKFFRNNSQSLLEIAMTLFGVLYVSWFLSFLIKIRFLEGGAVWVAYLVAVTKASDIGAYCVGTLVGRHRLIPEVSPKKSVEGTLAGLLASVAASVAIRPHLPLPFTVPHAVILGFLIGTVGQIGDLSESLMKRFCNAKDSGALFPGMGGVLDTVDSVLFTAPIFYFHLRIYL